MRADVVSRSAPAPTTGPWAAITTGLQEIHVLGLLSGFSVLLVAWTHPLWSATVDWPCLFLRITGLPCPTCYGTRALLAALTGDWARALRLNPLVGLAGIGLLAYIPWAAATVAGGWARPRLSMGATVTLVRLGFVAGLLNWIYLIIAHAGE